MRLFPGGGRVGRKPELRKHERLKGLDVALLLACECIGDVNVGYM